MIRAQRKGNVSVGIRSDATLWLCCFCSFHLLRASGYVPVAESMIWRNTQTSWTHGEQIHKQCTDNMINKSNALHWICWGDQWQKAITRPKLHLNLFNLFFQMLVLMVTFYKKYAVAKAFVSRKWIDSTFESKCELSRRLSREWERRRRRNTLSKNLTVI